MSDSGAARAGELLAAIKSVTSDAWLKLRREIKQRDRRRTKSAFPESRKGRRDRFYG
jgi:hypothetical protein